MLDSLFLKPTNHYYEQQTLFFIVQDQIYCYELIDYKNIKRLERVYLFLYHNEFGSSFSLAFYDQQVRNLFQQLVKINSIGLKNAKLIVKNYTYEEILMIVKNADHESLLKIRGIGLITAKTIIENLQKVLFKVTYSPREEKLILAATRLGYSRRAVLQVIKTINLARSDEECMHSLLTGLGSKQLNAPD